VTRGRGALLHAVREREARRSRSARLRARGHPPRDRRAQNRDASRRSDV